MGFSWVEGASIAALTSGSHLCVSRHHQVQRTKHSDSRWLQLQMGKLGPTGDVQPNGLFLQVMFYWNTAKPRPFIYVSLWLLSWSRGRVAVSETVYMTGTAWNIYSLALYRKKNVLTPNLNNVLSQLNVLSHLHLVFRF